MTAAAGSDRELSESAGRSAISAIFAALFASQRRL